MKRQLACVIALLLLVLFAIGSVSCKPYVMPENKELPDLIKANMQAETLDLRNVTDFEWDTVYIVGQYASIEETLEGDGVKYALMTNPMNDGFMLIFCLDKKIVAYCNLYSDVVEKLYSYKRGYENSVVVIRDGKIVDDGWTRVYLPDRAR